MLKKIASVAFGIALWVSASADALPHYDIAVQLQPGEGTLRATVTIHLPPAPAGTSHSFVLARSFEVTATSGQSAEVTVADADKPLPNIRVLTARTTAAEGASLTVNYFGRLGSWTPKPINSLSADLVELSVDSFWLPFSTRFASPFTVAGTISGLPESATVVSPNTFTRSGDSVHFERTKPAGDFPFVASPKLKSITEGSFSFHAVDVESPIAKFYREHGARAMAFLEKQLGAIGNARGSIVIIPRLEGSGYARPGHIVVTESAKLDNVAGLATFTAHELAHGWFSRANPFSEDYWLSESPAEYFGMLYAESALGAEALTKIHETKRERAAKSGAMLGRGRVPDRELYSKGPVLLFGLEQKIGREKVVHTLAAFAADATHTTARFLELLSMVGGAEVAAEFDRQMREAAPPPKAP